MELSANDFQKIYVDNKIKFELAIEKDLRKLLKNDYFMMEYRSPVDSSVYRVKGVMHSYRLHLEPTWDSFTDSIQPSNMTPVLAITYINSKGNYQTTSAEVNRIEKFIFDKNLDSIKLLMECSENYEIIDVEEF